MFLGVDYKANKGSYGIPFAAEVRQGLGGNADNLDSVDIEFRRHNIRLFDQRSRGRLDGRFGASISSRNFRTRGVDPLSPPILRNTVAVFVLEELNLARFRLQVGGRVEHAGDSVRGLITRRVRPEGDVVQDSQGNALERVFIPEQGFSGGAGGIGARFDLWTGGAFRVDLMSSLRVPALEELYSFGSHPGRLTFDIGDANLGRERLFGVDISFEHRQNNFRGEVDVFYDDFDDFVHLVTNTGFREGLFEAEYTQADARFRGMELAVDYALHPST